MKLRLRYAALSDVGRVRRDNQDSGYAGPWLLAIADGVGGAARGDIASSTAIEQVRRLDVPPGDDVLAAISEVIHRAHDRIAEVVEESPELDGTSTTVTAAVFDGTHLGVGHVGDSRGYLLRNGEISQVTKDHTFVQSLIDDGRISEDEARVHPHRNLILRAVDGIHEPEPDLFTIDLEPGDRILLCSDGASGVLDNAALARILGEGSVDFAAVQLVRESLDAGSSDNVTVVLADVEDEETDTTDTGSTKIADSTPMLVGAVAEGPRKSHGRGLLRHRTSDTGELDPVPTADDEHVDTEALRYAPRAPRRFLWLRRVAVLVVLGVIVWLLGLAGYQWTQTQYYVAESQGVVAIYQGVEADLPGLTMHHVHERTAISMDDLPTYNARQVRGALGKGSLATARKAVAELKELVVCPVIATPVPTPTKTPTKTPTRTPTRKPSKSATRKPGTTTPTKAPTHTVTPTAPAKPKRPSPNADGSCPTTTGTGSNTGSNTGSSTGSSTGSGSTPSAGATP